MMIIQKYPPKGGEILSFLPVQLPDNLHHTAIFFSGASSYKTWPGLRRAGVYCSLLSEPDKNVRQKVVKFVLHYPSPVTLKLAPQRIAMFRSGASSYKTWPGVGGRRLVLPSVGTRRRKYLPNGGEIFLFIQSSNLGNCTTAMFCCGARSYKTLAGQEVSAPICRSQAELSDKRW